jgi:hypothetical protein
MLLIAQIVLGVIIGSLTIVGNRLLCLARETNVWLLDYLSPEQLL